MKHSRYYLLILISLGFHSAKAEEPDNSALNDVASTPNEIDQPASQVQKSPDGEDYFPKGKASYYTEYYRAANLPSMLTKREPKGQVTFRLAILPSFTKPLFFTYSRTAAGATVEITRLSLRRVDNSLEPNTVELTGKVVIGDRIAQQLEAAAIDPYIRLPLRKYTDNQIQLLQALDGCTWILEVSTDKNYTMADVANPEWMGNIDPKMREELNIPKVDTTAFIYFCNYLLKITDMQLPTYPPIDLLDNG